MECRRMLDSGVSIDEVIAFAQTSGPHPRYKPESPPRIPAFSKPVEPEPELPREAMGRISQNAAKMREMVRRNTKQQLAAPPPSNTHQAHQTQHHASFYSDFPMDKPKLKPYPKQEVRLKRVAPARGGQPERPPLSYLFWDDQAFESRGDLLDDYRAKQQLSAQDSADVVASQAALMTPAAMDLHLTLEMYKLQRDLGEDQEEAISSRSLRELQLPRQEIDYQHFEPPPF